MVYEYTTSGSCSKKMILTISEGILENLIIENGCPGNLKGLINLTKGMKVTEIIRKLKGIDCNGRGTSCPDQLAKALENTLK